MGSKDAQNRIARIVQGHAHGWSIPVKTGSDPSRPARKVADRIDMAHLILPPKSRLSTERPRVLFA